MEISSLKFTILSLVSVLLFYMIKPACRVGLLTALSCGFIASYNYLLFLYIVFYALINYFLGKAIPGSNQKNTLFRVGILLNLTQLIVLKYASFAIDPFFHLLSSPIQVSKISQYIVPIGISYFTLQGIGYLVNIKMGWEKPERSFLNFLLFITFFPKFLSGPVERSNHFLPQIKTLHSFSRQNITAGFRRILLGLLKKVVIANQLSLLVNPVYNNPEASHGFVLLLAILVQPLYLYFDFSGYTDIAIGIARAFGIQLLPNFDRPFYSENVTTFWKRFHMSLAFWFNDYIFKQLSFKYRRWKTGATTFALFVTWTLFGIWHGAGWNFMILGFLQAVAITYEFYTKRGRQIIFSKIPVFWGKWIGRLFTYVFYGVSLVFFFSPDIEATASFFKRLADISISIPVTLAPVIIADKVSFFSAVGISIFLMLTELMSVDHRRGFEKMNIFWSNDKISYRFLRFGVYYAVLFLIFYFEGMQAEFVYFQF